MEELAQTQSQTPNRIAKSTFKRKQRKTQQKPSHTGNAVALHDSLCSFSRLKADTRDRISRNPRRDECMKTKQQHQQHHQVDDVKINGEDDVDDKEEVERKIEALQRIVPGGESLGADKLFEETAGYIMALQGQLKAMKALAGFVEGLEKEKRKFGG